MGRPWCQVARKKMPGGSVMGGATRQPGAATHPLTTAAPRRELCRHRAQMSHPGADRAGGRGHRQLRCLAQRGGMRSLRHVFLALRLRRPDAHGRGGHVHGQRPGERSTDHAAGLEEPTHRQGAGNGQLPAAATLTSSSASTCSARPRTPPMAPPCHLPGYLTATVCALSSGLSRSVAAAASVDTIRSVPPPRPYLVS